MDGLSLVGASRGMPRAKVIEIQRSRLLAAAVFEIDARGYAHTTVAHITRRARVSRRTFYELFADREACLAGVFDEVVALVEQELVMAGLAGRPWRERVRGGLEAMLAFCDREPALARVCVVQAMRGGSVVLERRERVLERLVAVVDEGRTQATRAASASRLTAEGIVGAAFAILHSRLLRRQPGALAGLAGELTGMIVLPYLGAAAARREQERPAPVPPADVRRERPPRTSDPLGGVAMRLTYRTARVLEGVHEHPGASNRQLAEYAEIQDPGQVSRLLARLQRLGLLVNRGAGHAKGEPNAWWLTRKGEQVAQSICVHRAIDGRPKVQGRAA